MDLHSIECVVNTVSRVCIYMRGNVAVLAVVCSLVSSLPDLFQYTREKRERLVSNVT